MSVFKKIIWNVLLLLYLFVSSVIVHAMEVNGHLDILQNIFFGFPQKKASFTDMKQHEGEKVSIWIFGWTINLNLPQDVSLHIVVYLCISFTLDEI